MNFLNWEPAPNKFRPGFDSVAYNAINNPFLSFSIGEGGTNLITNPTCHVNDTGWSALGANASKSRSTSNLFMGDGCLAVSVSPSANNQGAEFSVSCSINTSYIGVIALRGDAGAEPLKVVLNGNSSGDTAAICSPTTGYYLYFVSKTTNGSDTTLKLQIKTSSSATVSFKVGYAGIFQSAAGFPQLPIAGNMGTGYSVDGSSQPVRINGITHNAPFQSNAWPCFGIGTDGAIKLTKLQIDLMAADVTAVGGWFPIDIQGRMHSLVFLGGDPTGLVQIYNSGNAAALWCKSDVTSEAAMLVEAGNITSGAGLCVFGPESDTLMFANGGYYLRFAGKDNKNQLAMTVTTLSLGHPGLVRSKRILAYGGGKWANAFTNLTGTVSTSGTAVTGSGTSFTTQLVDGQPVQDPISGEIRRISGAPASNTSATLNAGFTVNLTAGSTLKSSNIQYLPPHLIFENGYGGDHVSAATAGYLTALWCDSNGIWRYLRGGSPGTIPVPSADTDGSTFGGATDFLGLSDTPANYTSAGKKLVRVNSGATALEFVSGPNSGVFVALIDGISSGTTKDALIEGSAFEFVFPFAAELYAMSVTLTAARTGGSATFRLKKNGSSDTTNTVVIDATHTQRWYNNFGTPVAMAVGDYVSLECVPSAFTVTTTDALIALFWRAT